MKPPGISPDIRASKTHTVWPEVFGSAFLAGERRLVPAMENEIDKNAKLGKFLFSFGVLFLCLAAISLVTKLIWGEPSTSGFLGLLSAGLILVIIGNGQRKKNQ